MCQSTFYWTALRSLLCLRKRMLVNLLIPEIPLKGIDFDVIHAGVNEPLVGTLYEKVLFIF